MQQNLGKFEELNVSLAAISIDDVNGALQMAGLVGAGYQVLADPTGETAIKYRVFDLLGDGVAAPAVFIINADRTVRWSHIGENISDRPSSTDILARLR